MPPKLTDLTILSREQNMSTSYSFIYLLSYNIIKIAKYVNKLQFHTIICYLTILSRAKYSISYSFTYLLSYNIIKIAKYVNKLQFHIFCYLTISSRDKNTTSYSFTFFFILINCKISQFGSI